MPSHSRYRHQYVLEVPRERTLVVTRGIRSGLANNVSDLVIDTEEKREGVATMTVRYTSRNKRVSSVIEAYRTYNLKLSITKSD